MGGLEARAVTWAHAGDEVEALLERISRWAEQRHDVRALALVGSWAHGAPRPESDVDLMLLTESPSRYTEHDDWLKELGALRMVRTRTWGAITERRFALQSGLEIDLGVGTPAWASVPECSPTVVRPYTAQPADWEPRLAVCGVDSTKRRGRHRIPQPV
jgi:predicted nucleotidyltransferase